jgi:hypothetical protein
MQEQWSNGSEITEAGRYEVRGGRQTGTAIESRQGRVACGELSGCLAERSNAYQANSFNTFLE